MINRQDSDLPMFTGTIDELLNHSMTIDVDMVERKIKEDEKRKCIELLMDDLECSPEEAEFIYNEIALEEVKQTVDTMVKEGLIEITGYSEDGEPLFGLTELGKKYQEQGKKK